MPRGAPRLSFPPNVSRPVNMERRNRLLLQFIPGARGASTAMPFTQVTRVVAG